MPRISVIIPTYNRSDYVHLAIQSVLHQTYQDLEIIVCDDGSTDNTVEVVKSFQNSSGPSVLLEALPHNLGVSAARNRAIHLAQGEFIAFLDSDDSWKPAKLEKQISFLDAHPDCIGVGCNLEVVSHDDKVIQKRYKIVNGLNYSNELFTLLYNCYITTSCFVVKRDALLLAGLFDIRLQASEDRDLWYRLPRFGRIGHLEEILVSYRKHTSSISSSTGHFTAETYIPVIMKTVWYWRNKLTKREQNKILSHAHLLVAYDAFSAGYLRSSIKHSIMAMFYKHHLIQANKLIVSNISKFFSVGFTRRQ